jgi:hypothetical protein
VPEFQQVELSGPGQLSEMNIAERGGSEVTQQELIELIDQTAVLVSRNPS